MLNTIQPLAFSSLTLANIKTQRTVGVCCSVNMCGCSGAELERYPYRSIHTIHLGTGLQERVYAAQHTCDMSDFVDFTIAADCAHNKVNHRKAAMDSSSDRLEGVVWRDAHNQGFDYEAVRSAFP